MNDLIPFEPAKVQRRAVSVEGGAQILFFTGVRYQRASECVQAPPPKPPRARRQSAKSRLTDLGELGR